MKSLYNTLSIIFVASFLISTPACLKENIYDTPNPDLIRNEDDVTAVIKGAYAQFNDASAFKYEGMLMLFLGADDVYTESGSAQGAYGNKIFTSTHTGPFWNKLFSSIANANALIETLDKLELSPAFEARAYGEAHFLRAFSYYYLVRLYGGVPIRTEAVNINSNFYLPRNTVDEVYAQIFKDLKKASELLPNFSKISKNELGRASKGAAQAILAQASLTYGNQLALKGQDATQHYQQSVLYADSVINSNEYFLINDYGDLFDINKESKAYDEVIFGVRFQTDQQARALPAAGSEFASRFGHTNTHFVSGNGTVGNGDGSFRVMPWVGDYYRKGDYTTGSGANKVIDYRNEKAFFQKGYNSNQNKYYAVYPNLPTSDEGTIWYPACSKYVDPGGKDTRNNGNDLFIIRFAEVYLIKAEAANELYGPSAEAVAAFNKVRERARKANGVARTVPANVLTTITKDNFRKKIFDERGLELLCEGQRWFDLVRMRSPLSPTQTMYEYQFKVMMPTQPLVLPRYQSGPKKYTNSDAVYEPALNVSVPKFLLFPIPFSEVTNNPKFGPQNPGW